MGWEWQVHEHNEHNSPNVHLASTFGGEVPEHPSPGGGKLCLLKVDFWACNN
jgi:hypothetical protein